MKRRTLWRILGVMLLVAAGVMYVWPRSGQGAPIVEAVRRFEAAAGDAKSSAKVCGPRTREWMKGMIEAAKVENRAAIVQRGMLDISTILDLRHARTLTQLQGMTVDDGLEFYFRESEPKAPMNVDRISVQGDQAVARLSRESTRKAGEKIILGNAAFFTRIGGVWYFEPYVLHEAVMSMVAGGLPPDQKARIVEDSVRKNYPGFDVGLWDRPRR